MQGRTISHYRVLEKLGEGGMGEVYLAEDTSLKRKVALKVLPEFLQKDPISHKRFIREAQSAAALDHPYICHINEVGQTDDGQDFICMEYVEGETLKQRLENGRVPLKEALGIASEIAEALEEAHQKNIIHRDLKPANIMVTASGHIKVMDFGLAKRIADDQEDSTTSLTKQGSTVGTLAYMSPEQICGRAVDTRTDIFSFGLVLYEILTGVYPFCKATPAETTSAIINDDPPPVTRYLEEGPGLLQHIIKKTLAKDADRRYQLIHEIRTDLDDLQQDEGTVKPRAVPRPRIALCKRILPWVTTGLLSMICLLLWAPWRSILDRADVVRFEIRPPQGETLRDVSSGTSLALSPDGRQVAYVTQNGLYLRTLAAEQEVRVTGRATNPFFSPDSSWLGFWQGTQLKKFSLQGGSPQTISDLRAVNNPGGSWGPADVIFFGGPLEAALLRVPAYGGTAEQITSGEGASSEADDEAWRWPEILPGGRAVLFTIWRSYRNMDIAAIDLTTGQCRVLLENATSAKYLQPGYLICAWKSDLLAVPFDAARIELLGSPVPVVKDVLPPGTGGHSHFSLSARGDLAYFPAGTGTWGRDLVWVDQEGNAEALPLPRGSYRWIDLSPDGSQLLVSKMEEGLDLWIYDLERGSRRRLTDEQGEEWRGIWTPDGQRVVYDSTRHGGIGQLRKLYWKTVADRPTSNEELVEGGFQGQPESWSSDGQQLIFRRPSERGDSDIWHVSLAGDRKPSALLDSRYSESSAEFSPDGQWIAYTSNESGRQEVYLQPFPSLSAATLVSAEGGGNPKWHPNGQTLFYLDGSKIMAASFRAGPAPQVGRPTLVFEADFPIQRFEITPNGKRFLLIRNDHPPVIKVVLNWFEELKRLVPTE